MPKDKSPKKKVEKEHRKRSLEDEEGSKKEVDVSSNLESEKDKDKAQQETEDEDAIITKSTFTSLGVCEPLCQAIASLGWEYASRIQKESLPASLKGKDIIGLAETGSGKTGAFGIPILQALLEKPQRNAVYAVILAPTRELAFQIHEVMAALGSNIGATSVCIVGGVDQSQQQIALARNPHVVTATPGRLLDHLTNTKGFHLKKLKYLVRENKFWSSLCPSLYL